MHHGALETAPERQLSKRPGTVCKDGVAMHLKSQTGLFCGEPCAQLTGSFGENLEMGVKY